MRRKFVRGISAVLGLFFVLLISLLVFRSVAKPDKQEVQQSTSNSILDVDNQPEEAETIRLGDGARKHVILGKTESKALYETYKASAEVAEDLKKFAKIHLRITGTVKDIYAWLGDSVDQGSPLLTVSSNELEDLVESYLNAKARYETAGENYKRTKKLRSEEIVSEKALLEDKKEYLTSEVDVRRSKEKLLLMGFNEQDIKDTETGKRKSSVYTVRSPIAGVIVKQDGAILGATVSPDVELYEVLDTDTVWIFADVPPEIARKLKEGTTEKILIIGDKAKPAKITYISDVVDDKTRTVKVRLEAENTDAVLRPGEFVEAEFQVPMEDTVPVVKKTAVFLLDDKCVVFVPKDGGFVPREVKIGIETDGLQEIKEGLSLGEEVVIDGGYYIKASILKEKIGEQD